MRPDLAEAPASAFLILVAQVFMLVFLFLALLYEQSELTLFAFILLAMGVGANIWSRVSLKQVDCKIELNRTRLFPGERLKITIRAVNPKLLPVLLKSMFLHPRLSLIPKRVNGLARKPAFSGTSNIFSPRNSSQTREVSMIWVPRC